MWRSLSWVGIFSALVLGSSSLHADDVDAASDRKNDSVAAIVRTWKDRGDRVQSVVFECTDTHMTARGMLNKVIKEIQDVRGEKIVPDDAVVPAEDYFSDGAGKFMVEWPRMRYEATQEIYSFQKQQQGFVKQRYTSSFDGSTHTMVREPEGAKAEVNIFPQAEGLPDLDDVSIRPLLLALWPGDTGVSRIATDKLVRFEGTEPIGKDECIRLAVGLQNERRELFWVSPAKEHTIIRYRSELRGQPQTQFDIEYAADQVWVPTRWHVTGHRSSDGSVKYEIISEVTSRSINKKIGKEAFDVVPPKDALISHEAPPPTRNVPRRSRKPGG